MSGRKQLEAELDLKDLGSVIRAQGSYAAVSCSAMRDQHQYKTSHAWLLSPALKTLYRISHKLRKGTSQLGPRVEDRSSYSERDVVHPAVVGIPHRKLSNGAAACSICLGV